MIGDRRLEILEVARSDWKGAMGVARIARANMQFSTD
jgi:hypothetical protein